jgi:hypothetical protein
MALGCDREKWGPPYGVRRLVYPEPVEWASPLDRESLLSLGRPRPPPARPRIRCTPAQPPSPLLDCGGLVRRSFSEGGLLALSAAEWAAAFIGGSLLPPYTYLRRFYSRELVYPEPAE